MDNHLFRKHKALYIWLDSILPEPSYVPKELEDTYGPNPLKAILPIILEYYGTNSYYYEEIKDHFNFRSQIRKAASEVKMLQNLYSHTLSQSKGSKIPIIPTCITQLDSHLHSPSRLSATEAQIFRDMKKLSPYNYEHRYVPPMYYGNLTLSVTGMARLHDGSVIILNESNIWLWEYNLVEEEFVITTPLGTKQQPLVFSLDELDNPGDAPAPGVFSKLSRTPILYHGYDIEHNSYSIEFTPPNLPHQQSRGTPQRRPDSSDSTASSDEESSSGDNDSSDDEDWESVTCCHGNSLFTAIGPVPPLNNPVWYYDPKINLLLSKHRISVKSPRLFLTGCSEGRITLHDGLTGYRKHIGTVDSPVASLSVMRRHHNQVISQDYIHHHLLALKKKHDTEFQISDSLVDPGPSLLHNPAYTDFLYCDESEWFPLIVCTTIRGGVTLWDPIIGFVAHYRDISVASGERARDSNGCRGVLQHPTLVIPLLPKRQQGRSSARQPSESVYHDKSPLQRAFATQLVQQQPYDYRVSQVHLSLLDQAVQTNTSLTQYFDTAPVIKVNYDKSLPLWSPFINFPFHTHQPRFNTGIAWQSVHPDAKGYIDPIFDPIDNSTLFHPTYGPYPDHRGFASVPEDDLTDYRGMLYVEPTLIISSHDHGKIALADARSLTPGFITHAHRQHVSAMTYLGGLVWTAGWDTHIKSWDVRYLATPVHTLHGHKKHVTTLTGLGENYLISTGADKTVLMWDIDKAGVNLTYLRTVINDLELYVNNVLPGRHVGNSPATGVSDLPSSTQSEPIYHMLSLYPQIVYTQAFRQFLVNYNLIYQDHQLHVAPEGTPVERVYYDQPTEVCRSAAHRKEASSHSCSFEHDIRELVQNVLVVDDMFITGEKECKSRVGLNAKRGGITSWAMNIMCWDDLYDDIQNEYAKQD